MGSATACMAMTSPKGFARRWLSGRAWEVVAREMGLSPREAEVARLVADDLKEAAVALQLEISTHTVHTHLERVYAKLGVASRLALLDRLVAAFLDCTEADDGQALPPICRRYAQGDCPFAHCDDRARPLDNRAPSAD